MTDDPTPQAAQPHNGPDSVARTPNPFLLFVEVAAMAVGIGYLAFTHLWANLIFAMILGIALGFGVVLALNVTRLRPLLVPLWAAAFAAAAWHFGWGPVGLALAAVTGAAIKLGEMRFLARHGG